MPSRPLYGWLGRVRWSTICRTTLARLANVNHPFRTISEAERRPGRGISSACHCCRRPWEACLTPDGPGSTIPSHNTCSACYDHMSRGDDRDRAHIELWQSFARARRRAHDAEVQGLREQLAQMQRELDERPEKIVELYIGQEELDEAGAEAQRAFRSRERAWQALSEVWVIHREGQSGCCRCGLRLDRCEVSQIIDSYPALDDWVREQFSRLQKGLDHGLPERHPAVLDPHWRP
jgi:hypothetical protein